MNLYIFNNNIKTVFSLVCIIWKDNAQLLCDFFTVSFPWKENITLVPSWLISSLLSPRKKTKIRKTENINYLCFFCSLQSESSALFNSRCRHTRSSFHKHSSAVIHLSLSSAFFFPSNLHFLHSVDQFLSITSATLSLLHHPTHSLLHKETPSCIMGDLDYFRILHLGNKLGKKTKHTLSKFSSRQNNQSIWVNHKSWSFHSR